MNNENPTTPQPTTPADNTAPADAPTAGNGSKWRDRLPRGRKGTIAAAVAGGVILAGLGFGTGYAVGDGDDDGPERGRHEISQEFDREGGPQGGDRMPGGPGHDDRGGFPGGPGQDGGQDQDGNRDQRDRSDQDDHDGRSQQSPDYNGDGQPDGDSATPKQDDTAKS
ncbi:hypothetical protein [Aeromicrobium duanguangcaii]|uniref:hypothetical protein n=1 Tax=Aeromicrobium duanguangcaii TaxID=2968086 RepID=UPI002017AA72|nr:hypothetical protein [Aeromicrobium duanguangcaii]MCL3836665.1 hypothetical protein [Aeromicrobium duanguangcaii]